jgi:hypothetical protein
MGVDALGVIGVGEIIRGRILLQIDDDIIVGYFTGGPMMGRLHG